MYFNNYCSVVVKLFTRLLDYSVVAQSVAVHLAVLATSFKHHRECLLH